MNTRWILPVMSLLLPCCAATATSLDWVPIGPFGGPINALDFDPDQAGVVYVATVSNGIFKSVNDGATWVEANNGIPQATDAYELSFDPNVPGRLYAATGNGLYRSDDSGDSWTRVNSMRDVWSVSVDPSNSLHLLMTSALGLSTSDDGGQTTSATDENQCQYVLFNPGNPDVAYCSGRGLGFARSTDNGKTWGSVPVGSSVNSIFDMQLYQSPSNPKIVYAEGLGIYRSDDAGATWTSITPSFGISGSLFVDPNNADIIYSLSGGRVIKSIDGGRNWTKGPYDNLLNALLVTKMSGAIDPQYPSHILLGEYTSWNGGKTFYESDMGLLASDAYAMTGDSNTPPGLVVGTGQHLYQGIDGGALWEKMDNCSLYLGGILQLASDHGNPGYVYAIGNYPVGGNFGELTPGQTQWHCQNSVGASEIVTSPTQAGTAYLEQTDSFGGFNYVYSTNDFGADWTLIKTTGDLGEHPGIAASYLNPGVIYTDEDNVIYKTGDGGSTWTQLPSEPFSGSFPVAFAVSAVSDSVLLATNGSTVERSDDTATTWNNVFSPSAGETVHRFFIDQDTPGTDYLLLSDGFLESKDDGATWATPDYSGLSGHSVYSMFHSATFPQYFYASTGDAGILALSVPTDLAVQISGTDGADLAVGGQQTYDIQVTNKSSVTATHLWLTVDLPSDLLVSGLDTGGGICRPQSVINNLEQYLCSDAQLPGSGTWTVSLTVQPTTSGAGSIYADVASSEGDGNWSDNAQTRSYLVGNLTNVGVTIVPASNPSVGNFGSLFQVDVSNQGPTDDGVTTIIHVPQSVSAINASTPDGACSVNTSEIRCQINTITAGSTASIQISGTPNGLSNLDVSASADAFSAMDTNPSDNYATAILPVGTISKLAFNTYALTGSDTSQRPQAHSAGNAGGGDISVLSLIMLFGISLFGLGVHSK